MVALGQPCIHAVEQLLVPIPLKSKKPYVPTGPTIVYVPLLATLALYAVPRSAVLSAPPTFPGLAVEQVLPPSSKTVPVILPGKLKDRVLLDVVVLPLLATTLQYWVAPLVDSPLIL